MIILLTALACAPKTQSQNAVADLGPIPEVGEPAAFTPIEPQVAELESGARLWLVEDHGLPVVVLRVLLPGGSSSDGTDWGRAELAAQMLTEAAGERSSEQLSGELRLQASSLWASAGRHVTEIGFSGHVDRLDEGMPLVADVIFAPSFAEGDWDRLIDQNIQGYRQLLEDGKKLSRSFDQYFLYGHDHPLGTPHGGVQSTMEALDRSETRAWHESRLVGDQIDIVMVGDVTLEQATALLDTHLGTWPTAEFAAPEIPDLEILPGQGQLLLLDLPEAQQTTIRVMSEAYDSGEDIAAAADLVGVALGGSFTSRLNGLMRETKGYTYGASSSFYEGRYGGVFVAGSSVRTDATVEAMTDMNGVLVGALQGFEPEELEKARGQLRNDAMDEHASRSAMAGALSTMMAWGRDAGGLVDYLARRQAVTLEQMNGAAYLAIPERGLTLMVGDEAVIGDPLREAGLHYVRVELPE